MDIKFTGDFKKLKPMGFTFHKLFANNYKVYEKNKIWIWVAHGGYVEIDDYYGNSGYIVKKILDKTYPIYEEDRNRGVFIIEKGKPKACLMDMKTGEIIEKLPFLRNLTSEDREYDHDRYHDIYLYRKTIDTIWEIKDMIEIEY